LASPKNLFKERHKPNPSKPQGNVHKLSFVQAERISWKERLIRWAAEVWFSQRAWGGRSHPRSISGERRSQGSNDK